jgi:hypothetical protein
MEERPKTPSGVSFSCELLAHQRGVSSTLTRYLAAPDRIELLLRTV